MNEYEEALIAKIEGLKKSKSPFARTRLVRLLKQLGELQNKK